MINNLEKIKNKTKRDIVRNICREIINSCDTIKKISIFGSVARGDDNEDSDTDFYLEFTEKPIDEDYIYTDSVNEVINIIRKNLFCIGGADVVIKDDFCNYDDKFIQNIKNEEVICYER